MDMTTIIKKQISECIETKQNILADVSSIVKVAEAMINAYKNKKKVVWFGNGGSAADAQHLSTELVSKFYKERGALPSMAFTTNTSTLTAISNDYDFDRVFERQVEAFVEGGADGVIIETMMALDEAQCALRAVKENSNLPVAVSMTFNKGKRGYATVMGVTPEKAVIELQKAGADIVGANCGFGIENMVEVARMMRPATTLPLWIKPNAGVPQLQKGETVYPETPEEMVTSVSELIKVGVSMIGGCCGTTPEHIRLIAREIPGYIAIAQEYLDTVIKFSI